MGRKRKRKGRRSQGSRPKAGASALPAEPANAVRAHLEGGRTKQALETARAWRKAAPGAEADALYVEAARARIAQLGECGDFDAAEQLARSVSERFPEMQVGADLLAIRADLRRGETDRALAAFACPDLSDDHRRRIGELIAAEIPDPARVAASEVLPPDHPLREEARAAVRALEAAAWGTSDLASLARDTNVPRSSPLASWKLLALGIEAAHGGDGAAVDRIARQMSPQARPAQLLPVLRALAGGPPPRDPPPPLARLLAELRDGSGAVADDLVALERAIESGRDRLAARLARQLSRWFSTVSPAHHGDYLRLLHLSWARAGPDLPHLVEVLRSASTRALCRYFALVAEDGSEHEHAVRSWEAYLGASASRSSPVEIALVRRRQAKLAVLCEDADPEPCDCPECRAEREAGLDGWGRSDLPPVESPGTYLERALEAHPTTESWRMLARFHEVENDHQARLETLEAWHEARPEDLEPILGLVAAAKGRGAIRKALRLLREAETLDPAHPEVREGRFRLHVESARRRLRLGKAHLARRDVAGLRVLPGSGDPSALLLTGALEWLTAGVAEAEDDRERARAALARLAGAAGAALAAGEVIAFVAPRQRTVGLSPPPLPDRVEPAEAARALALLERAFARLDWPADGGEPLVSPLLEALRHGFEPPAEECLPLCRWARRHAEHDLVFLVSGVGLRRGGSQGHRFLLERAFALHRLDADSARTVACLRATQSLARRANDREAAAEASRLLLEVQLDAIDHDDLDAWRARLEEGEVDLDPSEAVRILAEEAAAVLDPVARLRNDPERARRWAGAVKEAVRTLAGHARRESGSSARRESGGSARRESGSSARRESGSSARRESGSPAQRELGSRPRRRRAGARSLGPTLFDLDPPEEDPARPAAGSETADVEIDP